MRVPAGEAEIARARILELAPDGFEEVDCGNEIELAVYTDGTGETHLRSLFGRVASDPVADGWEDRWRTFHRAVIVGGLWIGPPWESSPIGADAVVVDPGRAFGTGAHPTTRACIELLAREERRGSVLDAGCGSGVVAIAAQRLGFAPVIAVDLDETAVEVARETCQTNRAPVVVRHADVLRDDLPAVDLVVANIELGVVEHVLARRLCARAVTSGYLTHDELVAPGWKRTDRVELDGWAADVFSAV
ncbi:MAG: 50S ribosomal protein L11 methyltransferase [Gaiellaceae bacterium]